MANCCIILAKEKSKIAQNPFILAKFYDFNEYFEEGLKNRAGILYKSQNLFEKDKILNLNDKNFVTSILFPKNSQNPPLRIKTVIETENEYLEKLKSSGKIKLKTKQISLTVWISEKFPLKISQFLPLLHIMSFTSQEFSKLKSTLSGKNLPFDTFPLKISYPLGISFYALLNVNNFTLNPKIDINLFDENIYQSKDQLIPFFNELDENYAKDFYDKYYLEKNNENDLSDSISKIIFKLDEAREIFESKLKLFEATFNEEIEISGLRNSSKKEISNYNSNDKKKLEIKSSINVISQNSLKENNIVRLKENNNLTPRIENNSISLTQRNNDSSEKSFFNYQKDYFGNKHLDSKVIENEDIFEVEEFIPVEIPKKSRKLDKLGKIPITPRKETRFVFKYNENIQKTIKCNLKLKSVPATLM